MSHSRHVILPVCRIPGISIAEYLRPRIMDQPVSSRPYRLLFVCLGNICRSPAAENLMNYTLKQRNLTGRVVCDSAGTGGYHVGSLPDARMREAAAESPGIELQGSARQFSPADFEQFDLILAMDRDNYWDILARDPQRQYRDRVKMMCDYCRHHDNVRDVPDPYYGGPDGFHYVIELLMDACEGLVETLIASGAIQP
jgi:protein-tyrosine phosphatase